MASRPSRGREQRGAEGSDCRPNRVETRPGVWACWVPAALHFLIWIPVGLTTTSLTQSASASQSEFLFLVNNPSDRHGGYLWRKKPSLLHTAVKDSPNYQHSGSSQRPFWHKAALLPHPGQTHPKHTKPLCIL